MKKAISILIFLLSIFYFGQNQRFTYEYRFAPDSTKIDSTLTEMMYLDVLEKGSKFYSYTVYHSDSLMKANLEKQMQASGTIKFDSKMKKGNVRYSVSKTYPDYQVFFHSRILGDSYKVKEQRKLNWKISSEKQKIGIWNAQKAETDFAGRHWIAWFCSEIPIQDGPYKFHGLPGLIVKVDDQSHSHYFELKGIGVLKEEVENRIFKTNEIDINAKQFKKVLEEYEADPTQGQKRMMMDGVVIQMEGNSSDNAKFMKQQEERAKKRMKQNNNKIEKDIFN